MEKNNIFKSVIFKDKDGLIYLPYLSLRKIYLFTSNKIDDFQISIGNKTFKFFLNRDSFYIYKNKIYVDLITLLGFKDDINTLQTIEINIKSNDINQTTRIIYFNKFNIQVKNKYFNIYIGNLSIISSNEDFKNNSLILNINQKEIFLFFI